MIAVHIGGSPSAPNGYQDQFSVDLVKRLEVFSRQLRALRSIEGALASTWVALLLSVFVFEIPLLSRPHPPWLLLPLLLIPFLLSILSFGHAWRKSVALSTYREVKKLLTESSFRSAARSRALDIVFKYQLYSRPPFVRGSVGKALALVFLLASLAASLLLIALL